MSLDFLHWTKHVPGIQQFWKNIAAQVGQAGRSPRDCTTPECSLAHTAARHHQNVAHELLRPPPSHPTSPHTHPTTHPFPNPAAGAG